MTRQIEISPSARILNKTPDGLHEVARGVCYLRLAIVNVVFHGVPGDGQGWVLIDAGFRGCAALIRRAAERRFGKGTKPRAIILTHGHFDHVGSLRALVEAWNVPIFAHELELPYLEGRSSYPPPDPSVGGGLMSGLSVLYPRGPEKLDRWLQVLPPGGSVPHMAGWEWLHTPGHSPGHISLWRSADRTLVAGDAFITTRQESAYAVATQRPEIHGPPLYYTPNWVASRLSVEQLACLRPMQVVSGHGPAMQGEEMQQALVRLADQFEEVAVPRRSRHFVVQE